MLSNVKVKPVIVPKSMTVDELLSEIQLAKDLGMIDGSFKVIFELNPYINSKIQSVMVHSDKRTISFCRESEEQSAKRTPGMKTYRRDKA
jgi:hypothetical protein